jgi:cephalosporin-C deacetylase-like acetyl esterase
MQPEERDLSYLWDMRQLTAVPNTYASASDYGAPDMQAFFYDGPKWFGKATRVFAYYQAPAGASPTNKVPAVVCSHGGGGTAYAEWVRIWNSHGYAAIAMDTGGANQVTARIYDDRYEPRGAR